jgi:hypothetical protein
MKPRPAAACAHCGSPGKPRQLNELLRFDSDEPVIVLCDECVRALRWADARTWEWFRGYSRPIEPTLASNSAFASFLEGEMTEGDMSVMIPDFKGHHFVEDSNTEGTPAWRFHCERCGVKATMTPDGSVEFIVEKGVSVRLSSLVQVNINLTPACTVRPRPA